MTPTRWKACSIQTSPGTHERSVDPDGLFLTRVTAFVVITTTIRPSRSRRWWLRRPRRRRRCSHNCSLRATCRCTYHLEFHSIADDMVSGECSSPLYDLIVVSRANLVDSALALDGLHKVEAGENLVPAKVRKTDRMLRRNLKIGRFGADVSVFAVSSEAACACPAHHGDATYHRRCPRVLKRGRHEVPGPLILVRLTSDSHVFSPSTFNLERREIYNVMAPIRREATLILSGGMVGSPVVTHDPQAWTVGVLRVSVLVTASHIHACPLLLHPRRLGTTIVDGFHTLYPHGGGEPGAAVDSNWSHSSGEAGWMALCGLWSMGDQCRQRSMAHLK